MLIDLHTAEAESLRVDVETGSQSHISIQDNPILISTEHIDPWEDVFASESSQFITSNPSHISQPRDILSEHSQPTAADVPSFTISDMVSDVPRIQALHATAGYREGISTSKTHYVQEGFDEGFALGGEIGQAVGWILGCFEAIASSPQSSLVESTAERTALVQDWQWNVLQNLRRATQELSLHEVFSDKYVSQEGLWNYPVRHHSEQDDDNITFEAVAWAHPLVKKWNVRLRKLATLAGVDLKALQMGILEANAALHQA